MLLVANLFINIYVFFFNDTATTEIYTLSLHDALPISAETLPWPDADFDASLSSLVLGFMRDPDMGDRKSTRLNSSHGYISYAVFCLKKKKKNIYLNFYKKTKKKEKKTS